MNRTLRLLFAGGSIAAAAVSFSGCVTNESTLFVHGVLLPKPPDCTVTADPGEVTLGDGVMDVSLATGYTAALLVGNQFSPRGAKQQLKTETTRVILTGAEITLTDASTGQIYQCPTQANCGQYSVYGSGFSDSSKSDDPGWGIIFAQLVPNGVGEAINADRANPIHASPATTLGLVATIKVFGRTLGGTDVESGDFSFPIAVCDKCLIDFSHQSALDGSCSTPPDFQAEKLCRIGQDTLIDCRACTGAEVCRQNPAFTP